MKETGCEENLKEQTDILFAPAPYGIKAKESNTDGYTVDLCYQCEVTPLTQSPISFSKDKVQVRQVADCSDSLIDAKYLNVGAMPYNSDGTIINIADVAPKVFTHIKTIDCPITKCTLKTVGCELDLKEQSNVVVGQGPFSILAKENNPIGYQVDFCLVCEVTPIG